MYRNLYTYSVLGTILAVIMISTINPVSALPLSWGPLFNSNFFNSQLNPWQRLCASPYIGTNNPKCGWMTPIIPPNLRSSVPASASTSSSTSTSCINNFCTTCVNGVCSTTGGPPQIGQSSKIEQCVNSICTTCINGICSTDTTTRR
jgi:hypothetical protein